jgi:hypothetical protein
MAKLDGRNNRFAGDALDHQAHQVVLARLERLTLGAGCKDVGKAGGGSVAGAVAEPVSAALVGLTLKHGRPPYR